MCVCAYACMSEWGGGWVHAHACGRYMHACVCVCVCVCVCGRGGGAYGQNLDSCLDNDATLIMQGL